MEGLDPQIALPEILFSEIIHSCAMIRNFAGKKKDK